MNRDLRAAFLRPKNIALWLSLVTTGAERAQAEEPSHWYIAGGATASDLDKPHQTVANAPTLGSTLHVVNDVNFGWGGQGEVGYAAGIFRIEAEVGHTSNHSDHYSAVSPITITLPQSGKNTITRYMANFYVELPRGRWVVSPFIGAGIGAAHAHATTFAAPARTPNASPSQILDIKNTRFAWQLMAGFSAPVTSHLALTAQYRWFDGGTFRGTDSRGQRATRELHGNNFDAGLRLAF